MRIAQQGAPIHSLRDIPWDEPVYRTAQAATPVDLAMPNYWPEEGGPTRSVPNGSLTMDDFIEMMADYNLLRSRFAGVQKISKDYSKISAKKYNLEMLKKRFTLKKDDIYVPEETATFL